MRRRRRRRRRRKREDDEGRKERSYIVYRNVSVIFQHPFDSVSNVCKYYYMETIIIIYSPNQSKAVQQKRAARVGFKPTTYCLPAEVYTEAATGVT